MIKTCPYCNSHNIAIGYHLGGGRLYSDQYAYHSNSSASDLETYFCKDCGMVIAQKVLRPEIFDNLDDIREDELLEKINDLGIMLINHHDYLPSLSDDGFTMQNIIGLIEKHRIFYTKAFAKRPVLLSIKTYQLLKRVKKTKPLDELSLAILNELKKYQMLEKEVLKQKVNADTKAFNKAFDTLLENMLITACAGKKLNVNWYTYLYTTSEQFDKSINGLHFNKDAKTELWSILSKTMKIEDFELLCK